MSTKKLPYITCKDTRYKILTRVAKINGRRFPINTIFTKYDSIIYAVEKFPNFKGDARKIILNVWFCDTDDVFSEWQRDIIGANSINIQEKTLARKLWIAHLENDHKTTHKVRQDKPPIDYSKLMKDVNTHKKSGGSGSRLIPGSDEKDFGTELNWREHSVYAHWAFSGDASIVALSARYEQNWK